VYYLFLELKGFFFKSLDLKLNFSTAYHHFYNINNLLLENIYMNHKLVVVVSSKFGEIYLLKRLNNYNQYT